MGQKYGPLTNLWKAANWSLSKKKKKE